MAIVYKQCIPSGGKPDYVCDICSDGEKGRVSGVFLADKSIKGDLTPENLKTSSWWEAQMKAGTVIVFPHVRGTYDGGTPSTVTGFGRQKERITGKTHVLVWNDKNHTGNDKFYAYIEANVGKFIAGWVTGSEMRVANSVLDKFEAKDAVEEDPESIVLWQGTATWNQSNPSIPVIIDMSEASEVRDLFNACVDLTGG